ANDFTGDGWLTDNDDTTCNPSSTQSVTVTLDTPIPLTWVRLVVRDPENLNQIQLSYQSSPSSTNMTCGDLGTAEVNDKTLDIKCATADPVSAVIIDGFGATGLCTLYISGGRNVALKQTAGQSSRFTSDRYYAGYAVDGTLPSKDNAFSRTTCTHTNINQADPGWWVVTFSQPVDVTWFL
ncbi:hypothetical protein EGW08_002688, partial [Elysia chlorotica]